MTLTSLLNIKDMYFLPMMEMEAFISIPIIILFIAKPLRMPESLATPFTAVAARKEKKKKKSSLFFFQ